MQRNNIVSFVRKDCSQLFCIFTGREGGLMMRPLEFIDRAGLMNRNVTLFRDPFNTDYRHGVGGELNSFAALLAWQRQQLRDLPHVTETYCVGTSMGGLAALRFGHFLRVEAVWAFAPRPNTWFGGLYEIARTVMLLLGPGGSTQYRIYHASRSRIDSAIARLLSACPRVERHPQNTGSHAVVPDMILSGAIRRLFPPFSPADGRRDTTDRPVPPAGILGG